MKERCISSNRIFDGKVIGLRVDEIEREDGKRASREVVSHRGGAAVLVVSDGKALMERQFRYPYGEEVFEIPAGKRDEGEDLRDTARRELEEETGLVPKSLKEILRIYPSPGYTDEVIAIYLADEFTAGTVHFDDTEDLTTEWVDLTELYAMAERGEIHDSKTLCAILYYRAFSR